MNNRNQYFATKFTKELERWKDETGKTQKDFSEITGIQQNSISRYKNGESFPSAYNMAQICINLNVSENIFYPQTVEERMKYDDDFPKLVFYVLKEFTRLTAENLGIDTDFLSYCMKLPLLSNFISMDNLAIDDGTDNIDLTELYNKISTIGLTGVLSEDDNYDPKIEMCIEDLLFIKSIQDKATDYIEALICKEIYHRGNEKGEGNGNS